MGLFACGVGTAADARPVIDWEEPRCPLCNGNDSSHLVEAQDPTPGGNGMWFAVTQCQDCGLCFTNPRPSSLSIGQFYPNHYPPHNKIVKSKQKKWRPLSRQRRYKHLDQTPTKDRCRLLDFGCGSGTFLQRMHEQGWQVTGIDTCEQTVQRIRSELGLTALAGTLPHSELGDGSFDVVTMRHSLEHVHQPLEVLRAAHRLLAPGGQLIVSCPNIDSLPFKWFGPNWRGLDLPRHLTHFTPDTLQLMLARAGFEAERPYMVRHVASVCNSAQLAGKRVNAPLWQRLLRNRLMASLATWYAYLARRSDVMLIKAVKSSPMLRETMAAFSRHVPERHRFSADRWRDR